MTTITTLNVGDRLPDIELPDDEGGMARFHDNAGKTQIIYFYPRDGSRGCRTQACAMRDSWPLLRASNLAVYGVNPGSAESHRAFRDRYGLPYPLLVDEGGELAKRFGLPVKWSPFGPDRMWVERATVIVDPDLTIRSINWPVAANAHFDMLRVQLALPASDDSDAVDVVDDTPSQ